MHVHTVPVVLNRVYLFAFFSTFLEQQAGLNTGVGELEELFLLHHAVQNAERLTAFVSANDDQTQTLIGDQHFHRLASNKTNQLEKNMARLRELKTRFFSVGNITEEEILAQGKVQLAKVTVAKLQKRLEMLYFSVTRRIKEISSLAGL